MKKKYFLPAIALVFLSACNNSTSEKEAKADTVATKMDHDMHNMDQSATVPALPAVPAGAKVFFANLKNDAIITSPFNLKMGTEGMKVDTAGPVVAGSGHHHLLIDGPDFLPAGEMVPKDSVNIHFGKGQTEYELKLAPGKHKLTLQMADGLHRSYGQQLSATINVTVKK
jgi:hypothetical protein